MQALNLQIVNTPQERELSESTKVKTKDFSDKKESKKAFSNMVEDAAKKLPDSDNKISKKTSNLENVEQKEALEPELIEPVASQVFSSFIPSESSSNTLNEFLENNSDSLKISIHSDEMQVEELSAEQISFLKSSCISDSDLFEDLVEDYVSPQDNMASLEQVQNFSIEDPKRFLEATELSLEKNVEPQLASFVAENNLQPQVNSNDNLSNLQDKDKKGSFFKLEILDSEKKSISETKPLFENIFTVTDERSVEQKISDFKSELNLAEKNQDNNLNLSLSLSQEASKNILSTDNQTASASGSTFQQMLTQQIQANVPDFVKAGNIVLHDNNTGSINMVLKPESLGNVKINLHLSDNVITGQITVNSKEAFEAFKQNLDTLKQAFQDSGFDNANLSLSYADTSSGSFAQQREQQQSSEPYYSNKIYGEYSSTVESNEDNVTSKVYRIDGDSKFSVVA